MSPAVRAAAVGLAALLAISPALAQDAVNIEGVWGATRHFGPEIRGPLEIFKVNGAWRAQVAHFDVVPVERDGRISFVLPGEQGAFEGRLESNRTLIRGFWTQPKRATDGFKYVSPLLLQGDSSKSRWRGVVKPLEDEFSLYLVFETSADGPATAFIRNPERNMGLWWNVNRVERTGNQVKLIGKFRNRGADRVFGEGTYRPEEKVLSLYMPGRDASFDFTPASESSHFHARDPNSPVTFKRPVASDDGWKTGTLSEVGFDPGRLGELMQRVTTDAKSLEDLDLHGLLIARHGKLVLEEYFHGHNRFKPHETRSASKALASVLVGAALRENKLTPSSRVYEVLGQSGAIDDPRKRDMTVEHLLTMSSGYDCDDWNGERPGSEDHILDNQPDADYYRYILKLPMEMAPGKEAVYCSINPHLLGAVVSKAVRKPLAEFFDERIARPLQMREYYLNLQPTGEPYMGGGAKFLPRDFMKLGQLLLDGGMWNGQRVLSQEYAKRVGMPLTKLRQQRPGMRYGYLWWTIDYEYAGKPIIGYFASGNGGQEVMVIPELDLVIACYGGNYGGSAGWTMVREYIPKFILPALFDATR